MIVIEGTVRVPPKNLEAARPATEQMIGASRAGAGCIDYAYSVDVLCPGLMRITDRALRLYEADPEPI
jgi:quinol monooxygenase YgiN